jgi:AraC-like DNA-binding protein
MKTNLDAQHSALVADACRRIETAETIPSLASLAEAARMSPFHFHRVFKGVTGLTPKAYASAHRARRMRERLNAPSASITDAIYDAGYNSNSRFYEASDRILGMRAKDYRAGGANALIRFAVGECALGAILVARSERGVCAIFLGEDPEKLLRDLQDQFPRAELIGADEEFERLVAEVVGFIEAPHKGLQLPLDVRHCLPGARLERPDGNPGGCDGELRRDRGAHWESQGGAGRGAGLRCQSIGRGHSLPSGRATQWGSVRLSVGHRAQARAACARKTYSDRGSRRATGEGSSLKRLDEFDWPAIEVALYVEGQAVLPGLLSAAECDALIKLDQRDRGFGDVACLGPIQVPRPHSPQYLRAINGSPPA